MVLGHRRRHILHLDVTEHPTAEWTRNQLRAALLEPPRFVHRDRGSAFEGLGDFIRRLGCEEEVVSAPRSPWQNPFVERAIGSLRRDSLDHVMSSASPTPADFCAGARGRLASICSSSGQCSRDRIMPCAAPARSSRSASHYAVSLGR